ncbi:uncharacterized protein EKO05_0002727 [Ascochyta rabiei]|uniref:uncharacterized protein n=1 Tax=Didymella rabiei TaxID=5454 RepID=UPI0022042D32|nr:uncharacterized protein EKO05_0002727 [Ascochyta rabiei]UPX12161.1 hypothetical protein EKO05_0002727 [Ascochyta rabiei]
MAVDQQNAFASSNGDTTFEANSALPTAGIAVHANNPEAVPGLLKELSKLEETQSVHRDDIRLAMLVHARALVRALETPRETMIKHNWAQASCHAAITACRNAGVFGVLGDKPLTIHEIAGKIGKPCKALARLMRHIAAMGYITETGTDEYAATRFSKALTLRSIGDAYPALAGGAHISCSKLAEYMQMTNYESPSDGREGPYQYAFNTKLNMFEYMQAHPPLGEQFNYHMSGYRQGRPSWMDQNFYPVEEQLISGMETSDDAVLLVDVGGGIGHDLEEFRTKHPAAPGRLVLQDLSSVINGIQELDPKIERMEHDFHAEQPLKAARAYYMHSVLHDWTDDVGKSILKQIAGAMKRGYSKLLINENVIPDIKADWQATALDVMMMTLFASQERTSSDWSQLLETPELGLKIVRIWSVEHSQESLIECELA